MAVASERRFSPINFASLTHEQVDVVASAPRLSYLGRRRYNPRVREELSRWEPFTRSQRRRTLPPGQGMAIEVAGNKIALFNVDGTCHAIADTCTHRGGPLSEGSLEGSTVTCPWHGANFDVCTGKNLTPPAPAEVTSYNVRVEGDDVEVEIS